MAETPDDILRALAEPDRLAIAGYLARSDAPAAELADALDLPLQRLRKHLNRLVAAGIVRLKDDRRTYRLDAETLRWAAVQVGPPRERDSRSVRRARTRRPCSERSSATAA